MLKALKVVPCNFCYIQLLNRDNKDKIKLDIVVKNGNKHLGWFYDNENRFISDELKPLNIKSSDIADYIDSKRFGYVA